MVTSEFAEVNEADLKEDDMGMVLLIGRVPNVVSDLETVNGGCCSTVVVTVCTLTFSSLMNSTLSLLLVLTISSSEDGLDRSSLGTWCSTLIS